MSVKGFKLDDGSIAKYDYNSLENITTDTTLSSSGVAADAKAVGDEISSLSTIANSTSSEVSNLSSTVGALSNSVGDATTLETTNKSSIVAAINEIEERVNGIGTYVAGTNVSGSVSVPNNTWTTISTMTLPAGTWIVIYGTEFTTNTTGERSVSVTGSSTAPTGTTRWTCRWNNASGGPSNKFRTMVSTNTEEQVYYLWATQNSGTTLTAYPCFAAIRIKTLGADDGSSSGGVIENAISELQEDIANLESSKLRYVGAFPSSGTTTATVSGTIGSVASAVQEVWDNFPNDGIPFVAKINATGGMVIVTGVRYSTNYGSVTWTHYSIGSGSVHNNNGTFTEYRTNPTVQTVVSNYTLSASGTVNLGYSYSQYSILNAYTASKNSGKDIVLDLTIYNGNYWIKARHLTDNTAVANITISVELVYMKK